MYRFYLYHPLLKRPVRLKYDPVGWDSLNTMLRRDPSWHGVFFEYTPRLKFIKDGRAYIHTIYEQYGIEAEILIFIDVLNPITRKYERDFTGRLNLTNLEISTLYATCNIENTGLIQKLKNRADVKVDLQSLVNQDNKAIPAFDNEYHTVELHSKIIKKVFTSSNTELEPGEYEVEDASYPTWPGTDVFLSLAWVAELDEITERIEYISQFSEIDPTTVEKYDFAVSEDGTYDIEVDFDYEFVSGFAATTLIRVRWFLAYGPNDSLTSEEIAVHEESFVGGPGNVTAAFNLAFTRSLALNVGDQIYFYAKLQINSPVGVATVLFRRTDTGLFNVTALTTTPSSDARVVMLHEAYARVLQSILGDNDPLRTSYYGRTDSEPNAYDADGAGSLRGILNGFQARGFPIAAVSFGPGQDGKHIYASLKDLIAMSKAVDGVGIGLKVINGKEYVIVEKLEEFYQPVEVIKINNVKDIQKKVASDYFYSEIEVGYNEWANEEINNLDEFNTKHDLITPITQVKNKLSLICPYIAGGYPLEFARRDRYNSTSTKDNRYDNKTFLLQLRRSGGDFVPEKDEDFDVLDNVISPETVYNAKLSPRRCIERNGRLIASFLQKQTTKKIRHGFAEGNSLLESRLSTESVTLSENEDIEISSLPTPLTLPEIYEFKAPLTRAMLAALKANPYGYVSFSSTDRDHKHCYILEAERDAKTRLFKITGIKANV
jgi:hypothetical protein